MKIGRLSMRKSARQFARKATNIKAKNVFSPRKLHKGGETIR